MISFTYSHYLLLFLKNKGLGYIFWFPIFQLCTIFITFYFTFKLNLDTIPPPPQKKSAENETKKEEFSDSLQTLLYFLSFNYKVIHYL